MGYSGGLAVFFRSEALGLLPLAFDGSHIEQLLPLLLFTNSAIKDQPSCTPKDEKSSWADSSKEREGGGWGRDG